MPSVSMLEDGSRAALVKGILVCKTDLVHKRHTPYVRWQALWKREREPGARGGEGLGASREPP